MTDPLRFERAACIGHPLGQLPWFPPKELPSTGGERARLDRIARDICGRCPHRHDCLEWAVPQTMLYGTWGGLTERERTLLRRERLRRRRA